MFPGELKLLAHMQIYVSTKCYTINSIVKCIFTSHVTLKQVQIIVYVLSNKTNQQTF